MALWAGNVALCHRNGGSRAPDGWLSAVRIFSQAEILKMIAREGERLLYPKSRKMRVIKTEPHDWEIIPASKRIPAKFAAPVSENLFATATVNLYTC